MFHLGEQVITVQFGIRLCISQDEAPGLWAVIVVMVVLEARGGGNRVFKNRIQVEYWATVI